MHKKIGACSDKIWTRGLSFNGCPSRVPDPSGTRYAGAMDTVTLRGISYAHCTDVLGIVHGLNYAKLGTHTRPKKFSKFRKPSLYFAFVDSENYSLQLDHMRWTYTREGEKKRDYISFRHGGSMNAVHLDGHGASYRFDPAMLDESTYATKKNPLRYMVRPDNKFEMY